MIERKNYSKEKLGIILIILPLLSVIIFTFYYRKSFKKNDPDIKNVKIEKVEKGSKNRIEEKALREISEEEKEIIEEQQGIVVNSEGVIEVDVSKIEEEMKEVKEPIISKANAIDIAKREIGENSSSGEVVQKEHDGRSYWVIQVLNGEEKFWVYVDDSTGEILFSQKED